MTFKGCFLVQSEITVTVFGFSTWTRNICVCVFNQINLPQDYITDYISKRVIFTTLGIHLELEDNCYTSPVLHE